MNPTHRIHLGNAWEPVLAGGVATPTAWRRRFGRPSGLGRAVRVWLVIERPTTCGVTLNGRSLPAGVAGAQYRHEIGSLLAARNELLVEPAATAGATTVADRSRAPLPADCGRVWLEIDESESAAVP